MFTQGQRPPVLRLVNAYSEVSFGQAKLESESPFENSLDVVEENLQVVVIAVVERPIQDRLPDSVLARFWRNLVNL